MKYMEIYIHSLEKIPWNESHVWEDISGTVFKSIKMETGYFNHPLDSVASATWRLSHTLLFLPHSLKSPPPHGPICVHDFDFPPPAVFY